MEAQKQVEARNRLLLNYEDEAFLLLNDQEKKNVQGIDVIAVKNKLGIGIQVKCYSNAGSNKAIQEVQLI